MQHLGKGLIRQLLPKGVHMRPRPEFNDQPRRTMIAQESHERDAERDPSRATSTADRGLLHDDAMTCNPFARLKGSDPGPQDPDQFALGMCRDQVLDRSGPLTYTAPEDYMRGDVCKPRFHWRQNRGVNTTMSENSSRRPSNIAAVQTQV